MHYRITGSLLHHTNDKFCVSVDVQYNIPEFIVEASSESDALEIAMKIVCPMADEMEYESISCSLAATKIQPHPNQQPEHFHSPALRRSMCAILGPLRSM